MPRRLFIAASRPAIVCLMIVAGPAPAAETVGFAREIRPILAKNCFACHGPDDEHRQAGLRLDVREVAVGELESGERAVVPGRSKTSELFRRITAAEEVVRMPPSASGNHLTVAEIELLARWIDEGAPYAEHWSFVKPARPELPQVANASWPRNGIDYFILERLEREGLQPSPEADRHTLIRRLSLDLRGLPPTPEEVERFVGDLRSNAYEELVDRFLADTAYGERWARIWLDLARYADSSGYGSDPLRSHIWRYRDWVIDALNGNMPYDRFTIEQIAGDLLPGSEGESGRGGERERLARLVATAFHRNTMTNTEGGTDDEEFRVAAVKDRINTTMQVWMGLTAGCAQCHNHKYDPLSQREYYQLYAFFNQTADRDLPSEEPTIPAPTRDMLERTAEIDAEIAALRSQLETPSAELAAEQAKWEDDLRSASGELIRGRFVRIELPGKEKILSLAEVQVFSGGTNIAPEGKAKQSSTAFQGPAKLAIDGNTSGVYSEGSTTHTKNESDPWWELDLKESKAIERIVVWNRTDHGLHTRLAKFRVLVLDEERQAVSKMEVAEAPNPSRDVELKGPRSAVPAEILAIVDLSDEERTSEQQTQLAAHYRTIAPVLKPIREKIARLEKSKPAFPALPVLQELPPDQRRSTHIMLKGNFLSKGEPVEPAVPEAFHPLPNSGPGDRLALARWLMDEDNPLTARVAANRFWARIFGTGLVETEEDFGTQGEPPSHPDLLDWLAVEFRQGSGVRGQGSAEGDARPWDVKRLLRLMVTSSTYRQSSRVTPELLEKDPRNRLLARAPRYRLEAEMVRDQALALSGLLSRKTHGPSVHPPQPPGLWRAAFNGQRTWATSEGEDRYRRGLYTFWRRTIPYPSMATFDAPSREICAIRRVRTNTPLQAFVTLNDPVYVECAQALARRIVREGGATDQERAAFGLELCLCRPPQPEQIEGLVELYTSELAHYRAHPDDALKMATEPLGPLAEGMDAAELAAWTVVANVLLNMDGVLTKN